MATSILLLVLAIANLSFKTARASSEKASAEIERLAPVSFIMDTIKTQIRQNPLPNLHGDGALEGVEYRWQASTEQYKAPIAFFDPDSLSSTEFKPRFRLYRVDLFLSKDQRESHLIYKELAWEANSGLAN